MSQKWKAPPDEGRGDPKHVQAGGWNTSEYTDLDYDIQPFVTLGDAAHQALTAILLASRRRQLADLREAWERADSAVRAPFFREIKLEMDARELAEGELA
jgi:hypothetical protein